MAIHADLLATQSYVNGQWQDSADTFAVTNPCNGEGIAQIANGTAVNRRASGCSRKGSFASLAGKARC